MRSDEKRNDRIQGLYKKALTGKYNWNQLLDLAKSIGVEQSTAKSYVHAVRTMLKKAGHLK